MLQIAITENSKRSIKAVTLHNVTFIEHSMIALAQNKTCRIVLLKAFEGFTNGIMQLVLYPYTVAKIILSIPRPSPAKAQLPADQ